MKAWTNKYLILLLTFLAILVIGIVDYFTGYQMSFSIFYLIPIAYLAIKKNSNRSMIIIAAFLAAFVWMTVELKINITYTSIFFPIWNAMVRLATFIIVGVSLHELKGKNKVLNNLNEELHELWKKVTFQKEEIEIMNLSLTIEKDKSEALLLNILPAEIAKELKMKGSAEAKSIETATILFTDFKGFTKLSEKLSPHDLIEEINICFSAFDKIITKHGVEKIKTIGDAYMAAGGVPVPNSSHAQDVVDAAIDFVDFMSDYAEEKKALGQPYFEIRIGINSGPIVAGIVGVKKFQYDIWGDAVNIASRMENSSEEGMINISQSTYDLIKNSNRYDFERRGNVEVKGKGLMKMYFVMRKTILETI